MQSDDESFRDVYVKSAMQTAKSTHWYLKFDVRWNVGSQLLLTMLCKGAV